MTTLHGAASVLGRVNALHVIQGRYAVSDDPNAFICTLLGSCVAACIRDPVARVGGLNHFLLPGGDNGSESLSYGVNAMELLINELLQRGARRDRLEAKLFGGGRMLQGVTDIGRQNAEFARRFLIDEGIPLVGGSLGGSNARRIEFWPVSGRARQQIIDRSDDVFAVEQRQPAPKPEHSDGGLELF
jgi:chemotaxis protein CheD